MKRLITLSLLLIILLITLTSIAQPVAKAKAKAAKMQLTKPGSLDMKGAYQMTRLMVNDGTKDSIINHQQLKMYTDRYMLYVHPRAEDSLADYGIATYKVENGKVIEDVFFTSNEGKVNNRYELHIEQSADGFSQTINFPTQQGNGNFVMTETYQNINRNTTSPLDGAWKQVKRISMAPDGKTNTIEDPTQFKFYHAGNFAWVNTYKDPNASKPVSVYGYGTFKMNGNNEIVEQNTRSSFASLLIGTPVTVQLKFTGRDNFQQTISWPNGTKEIEEYERLK